ncbi:hypothetical protein BJL95_10685 [Methylomonas sp. LWB]|uniref:hypothetical protein n=1 Tax=Methylomonas sp. LWB TaxID=1905845 RepID=UPI0008D947F4|nr:hypothetical protein [Methylomonas sp. LWB]OHX36239.1 hypothetical protein BJL95_10685 [Methylomonas sp. LWB]
MMNKDTIYGISILLTFVIGVWNFIHNWRAAKKTSFINTVTAQRIKWLEQMRQDVASFVGLTHNWAMSTENEQEGKADCLKELDRLRYVIRLRLNPDDTPDRKIAALIKEIPDLTHESRRDKLKDKLEELTIATQEMLKNEWENVKRESLEGAVKDIRGKSR